jgi:hypothetical protein
MTLNDAMHAKCKYCDEAAMNHRMTQTGNFYCLEPNSAQRWRKNQPSYKTRLWAGTVAKCNDLKKSHSLSSDPEVAKTIKTKWLSFGSDTSHEQMSL